MPKKHNKKYSDFTTVDKVRNEIIPEEFPEGPFGSALQEDKAVEGKSTPWGEGQHRSSAYTYPSEELHDDLPRQTPGAHPLHDEEGNMSQKE
ncbi:hypothetical protein ACFOGI_14185 [Virgibacillus xinjiangensis]|uniref:Cytosolic protein n=1 Tax=Virgibacillus xinjiangensis TaxID=393090 RepID=A0ABV7CYL8_9BACI